jgi:hypothetical protein
MQKQYDKKHRGRIKEKENSAELLDETPRMGT